MNTEHGQSGRFKHTPAIQRFIAKTRRDPATGCVLWTGGTTNHGYGQFWPTKHRNVLAHRWIYTQVVGHIPPGLDLMHSCDTPACVNTDHLKPGAHAENMSTCRQPVKLSNRDVELIRRAYATGKYSQQELADIFGVNQTIISDIVHNKTRTRPARLG